VEGKKTGQGQRIISRHYKKSPVKRKEASGGLTFRFSNKPRACSKDGGTKVVWATEESREKASQTRSRACDSRHSLAFDQGQEGGRKRLRAED